MPTPRDQTGFGEADDPALRCRGAEAGGRSQSVDRNLVPSARAASNSISSSHAGSPGPKAKPSCQSRRAATSARTCAPANSGTGVSASARNSSASTARRTAQTASCKSRPASSNIDAVRPSPRSSPVPSIMETIIFILDERRQPAPAKPLGILAPNRMGYGTGKCDCERRNVGKRGRVVIIPQGSGWLCHPLSTAPDCPILDVVPAILVIHRRIVLPRIQECADKPIRRVAQRKERSGY